MCSFVTFFCVFHNNIILYSYRAVKSYGTAQNKTPKRRTVYRQIFSTQFKITYLTNNTFPNKR